ncbi:MAG: SpoIIE family protein phosphatase, partial [Campylobacterota bacterium]
SFINHMIDKMIEHDSFSLDILIKESMAYIQPILLEEEAMSIDYILFDTGYDTLSYAKFAMPASLMQDKEHNIIKIKSNNPPMSKYQQEYKIYEYYVKGIEKFLFFSDGIVENTTSDNTIYADHIADDFKHSFTREDLKIKFFNRIDKAEDDITLIFINRIPFEEATNYAASFNSTLDDIDNATEWYEELWSKLTDDTTTSYKAGIVFTELYMNAYEHGSLGIDSETKHNLIDNDTYFETLKATEIECSKKIYVKVSQLKYNSSSYIITQITDEGDGFDTQILSEIFRNAKTFNGRGVFVSRSNSLGIYYNAKGTTVLYLHKI